MWAVILILGIIMVIDSINNWLYIINIILFYKAIAAEVVVPPIYCRDPDLGGHIPANMKNQRKFMLMGGAGAGKKKNIWYARRSFTNFSFILLYHKPGIGNFLIFFPAAFYFAALTGRYRTKLFEVNDSFFWFHLLEWLSSSIWLNVYHLTTPVAHFICWPLY